MFALLLNFYQDWMIKFYKIPKYQPTVIFLTVLAQNVVFLLNVLA